MSHPLHTGHSGAVGLPSRPSLETAFAGRRVRIQGTPAAKAASEASSCGEQRTCAGRRLLVTCMANPRRVKMVSQQIRREVSTMLLFDKVVKDAITPEHALGADKYLSSVATVSDVEVSGDLQVAKVYVSVYGDERGQELAMAGLKSVTGYVRQGLGRKMRLRFTPEVRFIQDDAMERGSRVLTILSHLEKERLAREKGESVPSPYVLTPELTGDADDDFFDDFGDFGSLKPEQEQKPKVKVRSKARNEKRKSKDSDKGSTIYLV